MKSGVIEHMLVISPRKAIDGPQICVVNGTLLYGRKAFYGRVSGLCGPLIQVLPSRPPLRVKAGVILQSTAGPLGKAVRLRALVHPTHPITQVALHHRGGSAGDF